MPRKRRPRRLINRYAQSRLYDVETRTYVSLERLRDLRAEGFDVVIRDVETGRYVSDEVLPSGFDA
jgi:polyhydroxyalkanoate synthesis regulator protein